MLFDEYALSLLRQIFMGLNNSAPRIINKGQFFSQILAGGPYDYATAFVVGRSYINIKVYLQWRHAYISSHI